MKFMGDSNAPNSITIAHDVRHDSLRLSTILILHIYDCEIPNISQDEQLMKMKIKYIMYRCLEHS